VAPNLYTIFLAEAQAEVLLNNPAVVDELARTLYEAGSEAGLIFESPPVVRIVADPQLTLGDFNVQVQNSLDRLPQTTDIVLPKDSSQETIPRNAFLIVDGMQIFQLDQAVVNIGRRSDNQLVIDDRRISRLHAQLRAIRGRFVVFDLDSAGGTWVNGQRVLQHTLVPGDVISLSGVPLVYGQDSVGQDETQDINPIPG
jgi:predicted component of type VI protein secretion system